MKRERGAFFFFSFFQVDQITDREVRRGRVKRGVVTNYKKERERGRENGMCYVVR